VSPPGSALTIVLDPGHGGGEVGAAREAPPVVEKTVVLDVARRLRGRLVAAGHRVVLTREEDRPVNAARLDLNGDGRVDLDDDLQARVDIANEAGADLFLSLHANGGAPSMRGVATYYCAACPGGARHRAFAAAVQRAMVDALKPYGVGAFGSGVIDEAGLGKPYGHLFVIGPRTPRVARVNPASAQALVEMLFVTNERDAALLAQDGVRDLLAAALHRGVESYLAGSQTE
jgi:N-acetylmuramoyl-L-alanine amidase